MARCGYRLMRPSGSPSTTPCEHWGNSPSTPLRKRFYTDHYGGVTNPTASSLVDEANRAGGRDNITVSIFQVEDPENPLPRGEAPTLISPSARRREQAAGVRDRPARRSGIGRTLAKVAAGVAVLLIVCAGLFYASRQVWFLGTDEGGRVALYRGLPYELPFGINLYSERYASPIQTSELSAPRQESVTGHKLRSQDDATSLIEDIETREGL